MRAIVLTGAIACAALPMGCRKPAGERPEVVVYTALDRGFSEPILAKFTERTGIVVRAKYDTEATKTVGLVTAIRSERGRPRCDVFWNNEIVNTLRLKSDGLLAPYKSPAAEAIPAAFRGPDGYWTGFAARARVILVNTHLVPRGSEPKSVHELSQPKWRGKAGMAKPLFGTTASHVACLFATLGAPRARQFMLGLKANGITIEASNKSCALMVAAGELAAGLTDTDDAIIEVEKGKPVKIVFADSGMPGSGVLVIPNTLALVKGGPAPEAGKQLIDYLLSPEVEAALAACPSRQIPLNPAVARPAELGVPKNMKMMPVDLAKAAAAFDSAGQFVKEHFLK